MAEGLGNYHLKTQKSFDTCLEMASYLLKIAKATEFHPVVYVAIFKPQPSERLIKQFQPQGLEPQICDTVQIKSKTGGSLLR